MEDWIINQMTPFDCRIATQSLQLTKLLIPYMPRETQRIMAIYVKFMEFQNTWSSFHAFKQKSYTTQDIFQELRPFMPPSACDSVDNLMNIMSMMEIFQDFQQNSEGGPDFDAMQMMQSMLTPEQQGIFDVYNTMLSAETATDKTNTTKAEIYKNQTFENEVSKNDFCENKT